ncbi:Nucleotide-binding universal stress protein, UspA family [Pseudoxanthomonas wuyuanensis]|uniref:Nucleotide-binding universal stress protein, UspA family n=2 Tax=Pseudoxanthomonas wuyuanensis TaxID=1073196 RepID=A0A286CYL0_9GAMM|nr:universal stress protein [Pseudoxanthomonas wuyuanensis]SOD51487.1 Nucleotide-binding universal stress protein, UspA family [Pseudoxanthomonas wuyuanensis]
MLKDIFIPMTGAPADGAALNVAVALAAHHQAHLTIAELVNLQAPVTGPWDLAPAMAMGEVHDRLRSQARANAAKLRNRLQKEAVDSEVRVVEALSSPPPEMAVSLAQCADLSVLAGTAGSPVGDAVANAFFSELLFGSGRPLLLVPPRGKLSLPLKRVVIGWTANSHAARAVHDALPLLGDAEQVDILMIDAPAGQPDKSPDPGSGIADHLARHGIAVKLVKKASHDNPLSQILIEHAQKAKAQMIVIGGYGHSRLREWVAGGMTREMLVRSPLPVLYSH